MKKLVIGMIAAASMATVVGCKTVWTADESYKVGASVGYTTAYVLNNQVKVDDATRNTIIDIMKEVQVYIPKSNETFNVAWTKIVNEYVDNLVDQGELTEKQGERIKKDFDYITKLLDSYIESKGIKQYQDCVDSFIDGFCTKFLANFLPANTVSSVPNATDEIDSYAYGYLTAKFEE